MTTDETSREVWVSVLSHRARNTLKGIYGGDLPPSYGVWPKGQWPQGEYYRLPASVADSCAAVRGLVVLKREPRGGDLFRRWSS